MARPYILKFACPDRVGLVAGLAKLMERHDCFIAASRTFGDTETSRFFARLVFHGTTDALSAGLEDDLAEWLTSWVRTGQSIPRVRPYGHC